MRKRKQMKIYVTGRRYIEHWNKTWCKEKQKRPRRREPWRSR
jgi:hypothetical protein